ncbi:MAG TPA: DUF4333 domain-containing protein [Mycobacteriales bacterium]|nr:DUF4333 domain-containing protein [Mycobacteriales bacterium]
MVDKAGQTCRSCLTLNPVGAPACVRCNSPLPEEWQAAPPPASPWSSPPNSIPVQQLLPAPQQQQPPMLPPLAPAPPPVSAVPPVPPPPGPGPPPPPFHSGVQPYVTGPQPPIPAAPAGRRRRVLIVGNIVVLAGLIIGAVVLWVTRPHYLDTGAVEQTVGDRIGAKVDCPGKVHREQGAQFTCTATYDDGSKAKIRVTVRNDNGDYRWSVLSGRTGG